MSLPLIILCVLGALALVAVLFAASIYNGLVTLRNRFKNAFSQIDVQLKRRYDLIPNLVETAKAYMKHESGTLESVIAARTRAVDANTAAAANPGDPTAMRQLAAADGALTGLLSRLLVVAEAYPDLKANTSMQSVMEALTSTENRVAFARQHYNDSVMVYNTQREVFPNNLLAGAFHFDAAELFAIEKSEEREVSKVTFN